MDGNPYPILLLPVSSLMVVTWFQAAALDNENSCLIGSTTYCKTLHISCFNSCGKFTHRCFRATRSQLDGQRLLTGILFVVINVFSQAA